MPHVMVKRQHQKIHHALANMKTVLNGLTRGLDLSIIDRGYGEQFGTQISYYPTAQALGLVMPSNFARGEFALAARHSAEDTRRPQAGPRGTVDSVSAHPGVHRGRLPAEAFGFYPTDHEGAGAIFEIVRTRPDFGDQSTTHQYASNPAIEITGPATAKSSSARTKSSVGRSSLT